MPCKADVILPRFLRENLNENLRNPGQVEEDPNLNRKALPLFADIVAAPDKTFWDAHTLPEPCKVSKSPDEGSLTNASMRLAIQLERHALLQRKHKRGRRRFHLPSIIRSIPIPTGSAA